MILKERRLFMTNIIIPIDLFSAINNICTGSEGKILMALIGGVSSANDMLKMTGITKPNHYFAIRKKLINKGYIDSSMHVDSNKIMCDYNSLLTNS